MDREHLRARFPFRQSAHNLFSAFIEMKVSQKKRSAPVTWSASCRFPPEIEGEKVDPSRRKSSKPIAGPEDCSRTPGLAG